MSTLELGTLQAELGAIQAASQSGFTTVTVQGTYDTLDGTSPGSVTFTLTQPISNSGTTIPCIPLTVEVAGDGTLSVVLVATDDTGTVPAGVWYGVTEEIVGAQPRDAFIFISASAPSPVQLSDLMPATVPWR